MKTQTKVSQKQFERFRKHVIYWQVMLGLQDWGVDCVLADAEACQAAESDFQDAMDGTITLAWVCDTPEQHIATIYLREDMGEYGVRPHEIDKAAFHELCHLLFVPLERMAVRGTPTLDVLIEIHRLIRVLENTYYEVQKKELK
jgi:hypothetical protein